MTTKLALVLCTALIWAGAVTPPSPRSPTTGTAVDLAGAWRLASLQSIRPNGQATTGWLGLEPAGLLFYHPNGSMAVQLVRDPPAPLTTEPGPASAAVKAQAFNGYYAYYGRYEVDERAGLLDHVVEQSLWPTERGHRYTHRFRLMGDKLILEAVDPFELEGEQRHSRITWARQRRAGAP